MISHHIPRSHLLSRQGDYTGCLHQGTEALHTILEFCLPQKSVKDSLPCNKMRLVEFAGVRRVINHSGLPGNEGFPGCGNFGTKTRMVVGKLGSVGHQRHRKNRTISILP